MNLPLPVPGAASVGTKTLAIYVGGATLGVAAYLNWATQYVPDSWEQKQIGPFTGAMVFIGLSAIVGAGVASRFVK